MGKSRFFLYTNTNKNAKRGDPNDASRRVLAYGPIPCGANEANKNLSKSSNYIIKNLQNINMDLMKAN